MKMSRSLKLMRGASIRTRKLARDMLVFWKRVDKEMVIIFWSSLLDITANVILNKKVEKTVFYQVEFFVFVYKEVLGSSTIKKQNDVLI